MAKAQTAEAKEEAKPICGIIMPIAAMPPKYDAAHWIDVRRVIDAAIIKADMTPQIVSDSFEGDVIQRRIISNLYDNPVVICDVSGLNPNVMFELGMRITFKQPVIIITDDFATIPFDTKVIEHLGYPRDLHIHHTTDFIEKLADRIRRLHEQKKSETFKSFIEEFGTFEVLEPTKKIVEADQLILDRLDRLDRRITSMVSPYPYYKGEFKAGNFARSMDSERIEDDLLLILNDEFNKAELAQALATVESTWGPGSAMTEVTDGGRHIVAIALRGIHETARTMIEDSLNGKLPSQIRQKIDMITWRSNTVGNIPDWPRHTNSSSRRPKA
ncbi:hypothetical protein [Sphingobium baderi]|uniref:hypothetical protein n=1 Tax=Sphingobium baderi TaxID=1332080 RepID=UPI002B405573|nr:hypothetical protein [Sphingobium baderi]WRD77201.1 hypothetical protein QQ987_03415 [Sphingobium baderi]